MRKMPTKTHSIAAAELADKNLKSRVQSVQPKPASSAKKPIVFSIDVPLAFDAVISQEATKRNLPVAYLRSHLIKSARAEIHENVLGDHLQKHMPAIAKFFELKRSALVLWQRVSLSIDANEQEQLHRLANDPLKAYSDMKCAKALFAAVIQTVLLP